MIKIVRPHGGYGLGNELIPWAKAWIFAQEASAMCMPPAWGSNPREYWRYFKSPRWDSLVHRAVSKVVPTISFAQSDFDAIGLTDFREASRRFIELHNLDIKSFWNVEITGLWGAFEGLRPSRSFLLSRLLSTTHTIQNIYRIKQNIDNQKLFVGLHVRMGDFSKSNLYSYQSSVNMSWPIEWWVNIIERLNNCFGASNINFLLASNGSLNELSPLLSHDNVLFTSSLPYSDISDLLTLSECDLICGSLSSFSMWAIFLGNAFSLWFDENFERIDSTTLASHFHSLLELGVSSPHALEQDAHQKKDNAYPKSFACGVGGPISDKLLNRLHVILEERKTRYDFIREGRIYID